MYKQSAKTEKAAKRTSLMLLTAGALSMLMPAAFADYAECLGGPRQTDTLRNPLVPGAPNGAPGHVVSGSQPPAIGSGSCAPRLIPGDRGASSPVTSGYVDSSHGSIFHTTGSQGGKLPYGYVPQAGRYQTKYGNQQQGMYDYGQGQRWGKNTYESGSENAGQTIYESGRELYGQRRYDNGQGMYGSTIYQSGAGNYGQKKYEFGGEQNGIPTYESGMGNYGNRSYDYGQGIMGQGTYQSGMGNFGQQTYESGHGLGGSQTYAGSYGNNGQRSYDYGQGIAGQGTYQSGSGNNGQRTYEYGSGLAGTQSFDNGAGNGGTRRMDNGGGNSGQRMYEQGQGNGGTQLYSGKTRGGGSRSYDNGAGNGGTKVGDGGMGNGGSRTTEAGMGNGGSKISIEGGTRQGAQGLENEGGPAPGAQGTQDQMFPKTPEGNNFDFQGPLPTVRTFCRYLVILGVVAATIWVGMASISVVMGNRNGVPRVYGAIAGLLLLLAGYTIWKIVQMNTFHANTTGVWANTRGMAQPRNQNGPVNLPQAFAPPEDPGVTQMAPTAGANQQDPHDKQGPNRFRDTNSNNPRIADAPMHYRDTMPNTPRLSQGPNNYRPVGPYTGHPIGPDRVGSYDIPAANIVPEPPDSNVYNPNHY